MTQKVKLIDKISDIKIGDMFYHSSDANKQKIIILAIERDPSYPKDDDYFIKYRNLEDKYEGKRRFWSIRNFVHIPKNRDWDK